MRRKKGLVFYGYGRLRIGYGDFSLCRGEFIFGLGLEVIVSVDFGLD